MSRRSKLQVTTYTHSTHKMEKHRNTARVVLLISWPVCSRKTFVTFHCPLACSLQLILLLQPVYQNADIPTLFYSDDPEITQIADAVLSLPSSVSPPLSRLNPMKIVSLQLIPTSLSNRMREIKRELR